MAVEILQRTLGVPVADLSGSDVAYDVHLRRVFMRTGLAEHDEVGHMVAVARSLRPQRLGELDNPVWDIGAGGVIRAIPTAPLAHWWPPARD